MGSGKVTLVIVQMDRRIFALRDAISDFTTDPVEIDPLSEFDGNLELWAKVVFETLFACETSKRWLEAGIASIIISSDDPEVLSWPWELISDLLPKVTPVYRDQSAAQAPKASAPEPEMTPEPEAPESKPKRSPRASKKSSSGKKGLGDRFKFKKSRIAQEEDDFDEDVLESLDIDADDSFLNVEGIQLDDDVSAEVESNGRMGQASGLMDDISDFLGDKEDVGVSEPVPVSDTTVLDDELLDEGSAAAAPLDDLEELDEEVAEETEEDVCEEADESVDDGSDKEAEEVESVEEAAAPKKKKPADKNLYTVWYGTNREQVKENSIVVGYSGERDEFGSLHYGKCEVLIPESHKFGSIGSSFLKRLVRREDDRLKLKVCREFKERAYWHALQNLLSSIPIEDRTSVVFIHGYNVSFEESAIRAAQIGFDLGVPGAMGFFSWPSKGSVDGYAADEATIEASEEAIAEFLEKFAKLTGSDKVHVIAHSMGNRGLLRAVQRLIGDAEARAGLKFGQVILAAPDIDVGLFKSLSKNYPKLSERTTLYVSKKDKAVALSGAVHDFARVGFAPPVTVVKDIDTVEVTNVDLSLLGHGYVASAAAVLYDMNELMQNNTPPDRRTRIEAVKAEKKGRNYWKIRA